MEAIDKHEPVWVVMSVEDALQEGLDVYADLYNAWQEFDRRILSRLSMLLAHQEKESQFAPHDKTVHVFSVSAPLYVDAGRIEDWIQAHGEWLNAADNGSVTTVSLGPGRMRLRA